MTFDRMPGPMGGEAMPPAAAADEAGEQPAAREPTPMNIRLQVLSTEHWSLLATRNLAWTESFARAGMFLSALSGGIVALALVAQATAFGAEFQIFAVIILPVVLFIGLSTFVRLGLANDHDALTVIGMNRIRNAYVELAPEVEPYLVMGWHDDVESLGVTMGLSPWRNPVVDILVSGPFVIGTINAVVAGCIAAIVAALLQAPTAAAVAAGVVVALVVLLAQLIGARRAIRGFTTNYTPRFAGGSDELRTLGPRGVRVTREPDPADSPE